MCRVIDKILKKHSKIKGKIKISGSKADLVAITLMPDNMNNMETVLEEKSAETYFKAT